MTTSKVDVGVTIPERAFNPVYLPQIKNMSRVQILYGGSASGKSKFKAQQSVIDVMQGGRNYLVCRQVGRTIRGSVSQEVQSVIREWQLGGLFDINKSDGTVTCANNYQVIYAGLDDVEKLKSITPQVGAITDVWVEEATETEQDSVKQLMKRQRGGSAKIAKRLHMTFNPILQTHWIYKEYFEGLEWTEQQREYKSPELSILKTIYKDNRFLTVDDRADLEREKDSYYYQVYTLGNWGVLGDVIFTNWRVEDLSGMAAQFTERRVGLDFGFADDPAAVIVCHYDSKKHIIYVFKELYETGLTNPDLGARVLDMVGEDLVTCDSAEPKSIVELANAGLSTYGAKKGKDSVHFGVQWLQQQTIIVDKTCINTRNELQQYHWKKDAGGASLPIPVDKNNHLIDALRYAFENDMEQTWWS